MFGYEFEKMLKEKWKETGRAGADIVFVDAVNGTVFEPTGEMVVDSVTNEALVYMQETEAETPTTTAELAEEGRRLASRRDDLIAQGVDPSELKMPIYPLRESKDE
jgi:hypothetical protein